MENNFDSESYWNRSASKGFSFDDDEVDGFTIDKNWTNVLNDDLSEASFDNTIAIQLSIKSIVSDDVMKTILQEQSQDDRIISKSVTPDEELKLLRRQIQTTFYNPSAKVTAYKMLQGKNVSMEVFKSLHEKEDLLNTVLTCGGGDAVIGVVLFLRKTLNTKNFHKILEQQPRVLEQYISYLKYRNLTEAIEVLERYNKKQEAINIRFQSVFTCTDMPARKKRLRNLIENCSDNGSLNTLYKQIFVSTHKLLELVEKERNALDNLVHIDSTPIEVLYACCCKHTNWREQDMVRAISPFRLCAEQQISPAQLEWTALNQCAHAQSFADLEHIFERVPTWHPMKQKQFHISFPIETAIIRLHKLEAPNTVLYMLFTKMDNTSEKLQLAQSVKCTKAIIDTLHGLKDINQLNQLRATLPDRSEEQFHCDKALRGLQSKRWSTDNIRLKL